MRRVLMVLVAATLAGTAVFAGGAPVGAQDEGKVTLTVGLIQEIDSANVTVGALVPCFEIWNLTYPTLTDKAADDFATIPGLAESWEASDDGLTYTYKLRDGLVWSDGEPLTADDIVYTIERSRDEQWLNHYSTVQNLSAEAIDEQTVKITSAVPDPKLPTMDVYIVPKHIFEEVSADDLASFEPLPGVGAGPFLMTEYEPGQFWSMEANPDYWGGQPAVDEIVFRLFSNAEAMVAALKNGEIDAAHNIPSASVEELGQTDGIEVVQGQQGGFDEIGLNGGQGLAPGHPALEDVKVRQAIAHAIDKQTIVDRVLNGLGTPATGISPSANPEWQLDLAADEQFDFNIDEANSLLDEAGYLDTDGNGVREMPGGGDELNFRYAVRSESDVSAPISEFVTGWLDQIGIATTTKTYTDDQLVTAVGEGDYDLFVWGWTPYVDPDPQLSYFTCDALAQDPEDPTNYLNDANWCSPEYDDLYAQQNVELDVDTRIDLVHQMEKVMYDEAAYIVLYYAPDLQAYRTDRFTGWLRQPAEIGPVLFSNTSPTYANLTPINAGGGSDSGGSSNTGIAIGVVVAVIVVLGGAFVLIRRRGTAEDRE